MVRTFKYRIYPTEKQEKTSGKQLNEARFLCNKLLEASIKSYKTSTLERAEASNVVGSGETEENGIERRSRGY